MFAHLFQTHYSLPVTEGNFQLKISYGLLVNQVSTKTDFKISPFFLAKAIRCIVTNTGLRIRCGSWLVWAGPFLALQHLDTFISL